MRVTCPYCLGNGRRVAGPAVTEDCWPCRADGYFDEGDDGYEAARFEWEKRGFDHPEFDPEEPENI